MAEFNINNEQCIICLEDISDNSIFLNMPISVSECKCIYKVHLECLRKNNYKCAICSNQIMNNIKIEEVNGYKKKCFYQKFIIINNKNCYKGRKINIFFYIFFSMVLTFLLIFMSIFYKRLAI